MDRLGIAVPALVFVLPLRAEKADLYVVGRDDDELLELNAWLRSLGEAGFFDALEKGARLPGFLDRPVIIGAAEAHG